MDNSEQVLYNNDNKYNLNWGENAKAPNPNPTPIEFGLFVKDNYNHMKYLLGIE